MSWDAEVLKKELFEETDHYSMVPSWCYNVMLLPALFFHSLDKDIIGHLATFVVAPCGTGVSWAWKTQLLVLSEAHSEK